MDISEIVGKIERNEISYLHLRKEMQLVKEIALIGISKNISHLNLIIHRFEDDRDIAKIACTKNGKLLKFFSKEIRDDDEIVNLALNNTLSAIEFASKRITDNKVLMSKIVKMDGSLVVHASEELRKNKDFVLLGLQTNGELLKHLGQFAPNVKMEIDLVIKTIKQYSHTLSELYIANHTKKQEKELLINIYKLAEEIFLELKSKNLKETDFSFMVDRLAELIYAGNILFEQEQNKISKAIEILSLKNQSIYNNEIKKAVQIV